MFIEKFEQLVVERHLIFFLENPRSLSSNCSNCQDLLFSQAPYEMRLVGALTSLTSDVREVLSRERCGVEVNGANSGAASKQKCAMHRPRAFSQTREYRSMLRPSLSDQSKA
jgi:hypothetical protein